MRKEKFVNVLQSVVTQKICDKCGIKAKEDNLVEWKEFQHIHFSGGYGSVIGDGVMMDTDLCQSCFNEILGPYLHEVNYES